MALSRLQEEPIRRGQQSPGAWAVTSLKKARPVHPGGAPAPGPCNSDNHHLNAQPTGQRTASWSLKDHMDYVP